MQHNVYIYILVMGIVTYLIRVLPLTLIRREIKNRFIRSFLYYVPYVTLAVMTFPAILDATGSTASALAAFIAAILIAWFGGSLFQVAVIACVVVFVLSKSFPRLKKSGDFLYSLYKIPLLLQVNRTHDCQ